MDPREAREALLEAVNTHNVAGIESLVDPAYVARNEWGMVLMDRRQVVDYAARLFRKHPEYRETLRIELAEIEEDIATLTTRRTESYKGLFGIERVREARQVETWERIDGRWLIVEERCLISESEGAVVPWWVWT